MTAGGPSCGRAQTHESELIHHSTSGKRHVWASHKESRDRGDERANILDWRSTKTRREPAGQLHKPTVGIRGHTPASPPWPFRCPPTPPIRRFRQRSRSRRPRRPPRHRSRCSPSRRSLDLAALLVVVQVGVEVLVRIRETGDLVRAGHRAQVLLGESQDARPEPEAAGHIIRKRNARKNRTSSLYLTARTLRKRQATMYARR